MTNKEFNTKYKDFLEEGYYGMELNNEELINLTDVLFQNFVKIPNFKYQQIKFKFYSIKFYSSLPIETQTAVENFLYTFYNMITNEGDN